MMLRRVVSGGQTGVDRAALDVAAELGFESGGWCPAGRWAEDGPIDRRYPLAETPSADPEERTRLNVRDSDATLVLVPGEGPAPSPGTNLTIEEAGRQSRPIFVLRIPGSAPADAARWIDEHKIRTLNIAGPRESEAPGLHAAASEVLRAVLTPFRPRQTLRLFVAIPLPDHWKDALARLQQREVPLRWARPARMHLTLRFIGDVDEAGCEAVREALKAVRGNAFALRVSGLGAFPSPARAHVVFARADGGPELFRLQRVVAAAVDAATGMREDKPFRPHITLARADPRDPTPARRFLDEHAAFSLEPWRVDRFHLYHSRLRPSGAEHEVLEAVPLHG
jgi:2'-5' RNA ligase